MKSTQKLRFVEREIQEPYEFELHKHIAITKRVRILQQWWEPERNIIDAVAEKKTQGEWRDVPLEWEA